LLCQTNDSSITIANTFVKATFSQLHKILQIQVKTQFHNVSYISRLTEFFNLGISTRDLNEELSQNTWGHKHILANRAMPT